MQPLAPVDVAAVRIPDDVGRALARLTGGTAPPTLGELANQWGGQLRDDWRDALLATGPTPHAVEVEGLTYPVNCALDGLMLPLLADRDGTLTTSDPATGQIVSVRLSPAAGRHAASHPSAVLALGVSGGSDDPHECACPHINVFAHRGGYRRWTDDNPSVASLGLALPQALDLAARLVGDGEPITLG
jgi:hypothetical protein